jgi:hypothetical protein
LLFAVVVAGFVWWHNAEVQKMLDKGCTPTSSNWMGPATFSCYDPKETQKYLDRGCTPLTSDAHTKYWSCPVK